MFLNEDYKKRLLELSGVKWKEIKVNKFVYHSSNPEFRNSILEKGLQPQTGDCYRLFVGECIPAIFATNSENKQEWFDSTWDDDVWKINTASLSNKWFEDENFSWNKGNKHIVTFSKIPANALILIYKGTGK